MRGFAQWMVVYADVGATVFFHYACWFTRAFLFSFSISFCTFGVLRKYMFPKGL